MGKVKEKFHEQIEKGMRKQKTSIEFGGFINSRWVFPTVIIAYERFEAISAVSVELCFLKWVVFFEISKNTIGGTF